LISSGLVAASFSHVIPLASLTRTPSWIGLPRDIVTPFAGRLPRSVISGRKVVKVRLSWWKKNIDEIKAAYRELQAAKLGRRARLKGTVERIIPDVRELPTPPPKPKT
jgi:hypothetical protein